MKQLYLVIGILLCWGYTGVFAQKSYTWHYDLPPQIAKQLYLGKPLDTSMLRQPRSLAALDSLPFGYRLKLTNIAEELEIALDAKANFSVRSMTLGNDLAVQVIDQFGRSVDTAKVSVDGIVLFYRKDVQIYSKTNFIPKSGLLNVQLGEHSFLYQIKSFWYTPPSPEIARTQAASSLRGYIAFCKPIFRHRDTLKAKIYAAKPNGRPYSGQLKIEIKTNKVWWDTLVSVQKGAYSFELPLSDTLPLDKDYTLKATAMNTTTQLSLLHAFRLEEYQLKENQYNLYAEKHRFNAGEKVVLQASARTVNNLSVSDAKVKLKFSTLTFHSKELQLSLDEAGDMRIEVPTEFLPKDQGVVEVEALFSSPGNPIQKKNLSFWYDPIAIEMRLVGNRLQTHAHGKAYKLWAYFDWGNQLVYSGVDTLLMPINPSAEAYYAGFQNPQNSLYLGDDADEDLSSQLEWKTQNDVKGQAIELQNPFSIPIWYQIGYKSKILQKGLIQDTLFQWRKLKKGKKDLYIQYQYHWGEAYVAQRRNIPRQTKQLKIEWKSPERIYPGQSLDLELEVFNKKGKPARGVNLTAGAISAQINAPLPHSSLAVPSDQETAFRLLKYQTTPKVKSWKQVIDLAFCAKLNELYDDSFYAYRFPKNGYLDFLSPTENQPYLTQRAFFAPFIAKSGKIEPVTTIYVDDTLMYYGGTAAITPYCFQGHAGYHCISVHTSSGLYQIDSLLLEQGKRLDLFVCAEEIYKSAKAAHVYSFPFEGISTQEKKDLYNSMLCLKGPIEALYAWDNLGHSYVSNRQTDTNPTRLIGPFVPGGKIHLIQSHFRAETFDFPPSKPFNFLADSIQKKDNLEIARLLVFPIPKIGDRYAIPLSELPAREVYYTTGFNIHEYKWRQYADYLTYGKDQVIKGRIIDIFGQLLIGANVVIQGTTIGTVTDANGYFELNIPNPQEATIEIIYLGYHSQLYKVRFHEKPDTTEIVMEDRSFKLLEMVVTGYAVQSKKEMMGYASTIKNKEISTRRAIRSGSKNQQSIAKPLGTQLNILPNRIRSKFSDYAFWKPNLITDQNGKSSFTVQFPENITSWKTFALGMDEKGSMGIGTKSIAAYKPLQARLYVPRFLVAGDSVAINAKVSNLTAQPTLIHTYFEQNQLKLKDSNFVAVESSNLLQTIIVPAKQDSLSLTFGLNAGQYLDGESYQIPIVPIGRLKPHGKLIEINRDTLLALTLDSGMVAAKLTTIPGGVLKLLLDDIKYLREYHFGCNEQTSSKLTALLLEKSLRSMLNEPFPLESDVYEGIGILEERQLPEGGWAWWQTGQQRFWTTNYVLQTLLRAAQAGYPVKVLEKGLSFLKNNLDKMNEEDRLVSIETLTKAGKKPDLTSLNKKGNENSLYTILLRQQMLQANGQQYSLDTLYKYQRFTDSGGAFWNGEEIFGFSGYRIADCSTQNTLIAYSIFKKAGKEEELKKIRRYFLGNRGFYDGNYRYGGRWNNTMEVAKILEAILPDLMKDHKIADNPREKSATKPNPYKTLNIGEKPLSLDLSKSDTFFIQLNGEVETVYLTHTQYSKSEEKQTQSKPVFTVKSSFIEANQQVESLRNDTPVSLRVEVENFKPANYVMIEIPIPAGCTYFNKQESRNGHEAHREYFTDRVAIFCDALPAGKHQFEVQLAPQFTGSFTLNPVWVEDMYHPLENGSNYIRKVLIKP
ncbi:alpha-2-macroglobulin family protein [Haliscomenobacter sp.]|uniref:alpha-2-macroglobulin family protein n=1 Tax=Haliscomenobacter sp. TaxID=2717303 RepID=UPI003364FDC2